MAAGSAPVFVSDLDSVLRSEGALRELQALARACGEEMDHIPARVDDAWVAYKRERFWWRLQRDSHDVVFERVIAGLHRARDDAEQDAWMEALGASSALRSQPPRLGPLGLRWRRVVFFIRHCAIEDAVARGDLPASELDSAQALLGLQESWRFAGALLGLTLLAGLLA